MRNQSALLRDVMIGEVICARPEQSVEEITRLMLERNIGGMPVVGADEKLLGIVTESDILRGGWEPETWEISGVEPDGFQVEQVPRALVAEVMTPFMFSLPADTPIARAAALMAYEGIHRLGVIGDDGELVGMITSLEVMRWIARESGFLIGDRTERQVSVMGSVMIVDDDLDLVTGYSELIREEGYAVVTATNGVDAMARLDAGAPPSLIMMDLNMPMMDGRRLRSELLRDPRLARIPIVVMSGDRDGSIETRKLGVDGYLAKPLTLDQLLGTVEQYCRN